jgi:hypothetical protein
MTREEDTNVSGRRGATTSGPFGAAALAESADSLARQAGEVATGAANAYAEWQADLAGELDGLRTRLAELADAHARLAAELDLEAVPDIDSVRSYWRAAVDQILTPLRSAVSVPVFGVWLTQRFEGLLTDIMSLSQQFPDEATVPFVATLLDAAPDDSLRIRALKRAIRLRRAATGSATSVANFVRRTARRESIPPVIESRSFDARRLAGSVLGELITDRVIPELGRLRGDLAVAALRLAQASSSWIEAILLADAELHTGPPDRDRYFADLPDTAEDEPAEEDLQETAEGPSPGALDADGVNEDADETSVSQILKEAIEAMSTGLIEAQNSLAPSPGLSIDDFDGIKRSLDGRFSIAGTSLDSGPESGDSVGMGLLSQEESDKWLAWMSAVDGRLLYDAIGPGIRSRLLEVESRVLGQAASTQVVPLIEGYESIRGRLQAAARHVEDKSSRGSSKESAAAVTLRLEKLKEELSQSVEDVLAALTRRTSDPDSTEQPGSAEWDAFVQFVSDQPDELLILRLPERPPAADERREAVSVDIPAAVGTELVHRLPLRLKEPFQQLRRGTRAARSDWGQIGQIVDFNLTTAIRELTPERGEDEAGDAATARQETTVAERIATATQLTADGIERAEGTALRIVATLRQEWTLYCETVTEELAEDWEAIHRRLRRIDSDQRQWTGVGFRMQRRAEAKQAEIAEGLGRYLEVVRRQARLRIRQIRSLIRVGRAAVGVAASTEDDRIAALEALNTVEDTLAALPRVYGHLFALAPLSDPGLLEGRSKDLVSVRRHYERWRDNHRGGVLVLLAEPGTGRTSVMNVLRKTVFSDTSATRIRLTERVRSPDMFAKLAAEAMGLKITKPTLAALEQQLLASGRSDSLRVCLVDNLEHLVLRASQSTDVVGECLLFMSQSDRAVYWIAAATPSTWQFLSRANPTAATLVDSYQLTEVTGSVLEATIMNRHVRSGLSVIFEPPAAPSTLLKVRLRRAATPADRQSILRAEYFERLSRACGQNFALALTYWIRSVKVDEDEGVLRVSYFAPLKFDYLSELSLEHMFTLKGFVVHNTLTVDDHARVFRLPRAASIALFESLLNQQVIEEVDAPAGSEGDYHVRDGARYRIRPLLIHTVSSLLRARNLIY